MEEFSAVNGGASDPSGDLNPAIVPFERVLLLTPAVFFCIICRELMELSLEVPTLLGGAMFNTGILSNAPLLTRSWCVNDALIIRTEGTKGRSIVFGKKQSLYL